MRQLMLDKLFKLMVNNSYNNISQMRRFMMQYKGRPMSDADKVDISDLRKFVESLTDEGLLQLWDATLTFRRGY